ncbi:MAG TPA: hypothetical protein VFB80_20050 [Pirellulaceae bacterium]|nr:hypothetical protein [Pirellulaceae bacterium]
MSEGESSAEGRGYAAAVVLALMGVVSLLALPFVPLLLALIEGMTFGTRRVEDFCEQVGIHDELTALYQTIFGIFK